MAVTESACPKSHDFLNYLYRRDVKWNEKRGKSDYRSDNKIWANSANDKLGLYLLASHLSIPIPEIYFATSEGHAGLKALLHLLPKKNFVIKDKNGFNSKGVFVLPEGFGHKEALTGKVVRAKDVVKWFKRSRIMDIYAEEYIDTMIPGEPPYDWKFYMFNGKVATVFIVAHRGTKNVCANWVDEEWNRMDQDGCYVQATDEYRAAAFAEHPEGLDENMCNSHRPASTKATKHLKFGHKCDQFPKPPQWPEMVKLAKKVSEALGVFFRVDLYLTPKGRVVLGEVTPYPTGAKYTCAAPAKSGSSGRESCVDHCFMGKMWSEWNSGEVKEGGPILPTPPYYVGWQEKSEREKSDVIMAINRGTFNFTKEGGFITDKANVSNVTVSHARTPRKKRRRRRGKKPSLKKSKVRKSKKSKTKKEDDSAVKEEQNKKRRFAASVGK